MDFSLSVMKRHITGKALGRVSPKNTLEGSFMMSHRRGAVRIIIVLLPFLLVGCASTVESARQREPRPVAEVMASVRQVASCLTDYYVRRDRVVVPNQVDDRGSTRLTVFATRSMHSPRVTHYAQWPIAIAEIEVIALGTASSTVAVRAPPALVDINPLPRRLREELRRCGLAFSAA